MDSELLAVFVLFGSFFAMLALGVPVAFGIAVSSFFAMAAYADVELALKAAAQGLATGVDSFTFLAIPLFVIAGTVMNSGSIARRLINLANVVAAPLPGALAHCNIIANTLFGALAGIASAAAIAVGGTIIPTAEKKGYHKDFMAAVNAASAPAGLIIPPSGSLILFSLYSGGTSIAALFIAGYIPGAIWGLACIIPALIFTRRHKYPTTPYPPLKQIFLAFWQAIPPLMMILLVIGGIVGGFFTPTEAAGMAVFFSVFLSMAYRDMSFRQLPKIFIDSVVPTAICTFLVAASGVMGWALNFAAIPTLISEAILSVSDNYVILLLLINLMLLLVGTFLDLTPALIIFTPILLPIFTELGMHPVHVGIMMVFNLCIGLISPPVGTLLFVSCTIAKIPFQSILRPILPIIGVLIVGLLLITFIPELSLFLPRAFGLIR